MFLGTTGLEISLTELRKVFHEITEIEYPCFRLEVLKMLHDRDPGIHKLLCLLMSKERIYNGSSKIDHKIFKNKTANTFESLNKTLSIHSGTSICKLFIFSFSEIYSMIP